MEQRGPFGTSAVLIVAFSGKAGPQQQNCCEHKALDQVTEGSGRLPRPLPFALS